MEVSAMADAIAVATNHSIGFANFILGRHYCNSFSNLSVFCGSSSESSSYTTGGGLLSISAGISAVIAPPAIRSNAYITVPRTFTRRRRRQKRTKRRTSRGDSEEDGGEDGFFGDGDGDDGPFGGGGRCGGSGGRGWNFDGRGGSDWGEEEESSYSSSYSDLALDFIYEVICWIALSNCSHFAFKKLLVRIVSREKVPMRLVSMC